MKEQAFTVRNSQKEVEVTIPGATLSDALWKAGLNPRFWKEVPTPESTEKTDSGEDN